MSDKDLRYIVFLLNPDTQQYLSGRRVDTHDGEIFRSLKEAKDYAIKSIDEHHCTRFAIGVFVIDQLAECMIITSIETFGFRNDKKIVNQLELFN